MAQTAKHHAALDMTMRIYTDPRLLDVAAALSALPELPLDGPAHSAAQVLEVLAG